MHIPPRYLRQIVFAISIILLLLDVWVFLVAKDRRQIDIFDADSLYLSYWVCNAREDVGIASDLFECLAKSVVSDMLEELQDLWMWIRAYLLAGLILLYVLTSCHFTIWCRPNVHMTDLLLLLIQLLVPPLHFLLQLYIQPRFINIKVQLIQIIDLSLDLFPQNLQVHILCLRLNGYLFQLLLVPLLLDIKLLKLMLQPLDIIYFFLSHLRNLHARPAVLVALIDQF